MRAGSVHPPLSRVRRLPRWFEWFDALLVEELAPNPRRISTSLRLATIGTAGAVLMAVCHVDTALVPYLVWLMLGTGPMMSLQRAFAYLAVEAPLLALTVPVAALLSETPWLMLPLIGGFTAFSTYQINQRHLASFGLLLEVVTLDSLYGVMYAPDSFGWTASAVFGASVIGFLLIAIFDRWVWPNPAQAILQESFAASLWRARSRLLAITGFYIEAGAGERPPEPSVVSEMPTARALLERATAEGISEHRKAILLAIAVGAIAGALDEAAHEVLTVIPTGVNEPPLPRSAEVRPAIDALERRILQLRPSYIGWAGIAEIANFTAFTQGPTLIARLLERRLDEPPLTPASGEAASHMLASSAHRDQTLMRHCAKVGLCLVIGYVVGLTTQRADLSVILTTIIITALPTYGASLRKMILRIVGTAIGGIITILLIIIVTPNFETPLSYGLATFVVLFISGYSSLGSERIAYAGKSIGTTFLLAFAGLSPSVDVYGPLWRIWGILLGSFVVAIVFFILWPEYSGDSLLPRLRKVIRDVIDLVPGGCAAASEAANHAANVEITQLLSEILQIADDAGLEGRTSLIDHDAVVHSAGTIRRISHRLAGIAQARIETPLPPLNQAAESACAAVLGAIREQLESWLTLYEGPRSLQSAAAHALAVSHQRDAIARPLQEFCDRLEADRFAIISAWQFEQRRTILVELQSLHRLEFLMGELDDFLSRVPGGAQSPHR